MARSFTIGGWVKRLLREEGVFECDSGKVQGSCQSLSTDEALAAGGNISACYEEAFRAMPPLV